MQLQSSSPPTSLLVLVLALLTDFVLGEPWEKLHPTVWAGKTIAYLKPKTKSPSPSIEKLNGILLSLMLITILAGSTYFLLSLSRLFLSELAYILIASAILKSTIAIKSMEAHARPIMKAIEEGNLDQARTLVARIVRRNTSELDELRLTSATIESIGEGTVDGVTSALFYFAFFGVPGAIAFRVINTLDSMIGYRDVEHRNVGWFSAKLDTAANYIPARLTAFIMILSALLLGESWRSSIGVLARDRNKTESPNAGWSMSALAGALETRLEKPGFYVLGEGKLPLTGHIPRALRMMKLTSFLFLAIVVIPLILLIPRVVGG